MPKHGRTVLGLGQSSQLCLGCQRLANCARQRGVSCSIFEAKQAAMRALFGIAELHSIIASPMQAARRAAVASSWASAAVGSTPMSKPTAASIPLQLLIMTISLRDTAAGFDTGPLCRSAAMEFVCFFCVQRRAIDVERTKQTIGFPAIVAAAGQVMPI